MINENVYTFYKEGYDIRYSILWCFIPLNLEMDCAEQCTSRFTFFTEETNWHEASSRCNGMGQRLAVLDTNAKVDDALFQM